MKMKSTLAAILLCALSLSAPLAARSTQFSRLGIITAAKSLGKWPQLKAWIAASGYEDEWLVCSYLSDDFPQFPAITNAIATALIATPDEIAAILAASRDPALPDDLQQRHYDRAMLTPSGRVSWHGPCTASYIDTNECIHVWRYEDGYTYTEPWTRPKSDIERAIERAQAAAATWRAKAQTAPPEVAEIYLRRADAIMDKATNRVDVIDQTIEAN